MGQLGCKPSKEPGSQPGMFLPAHGQLKPSSKEKVQAREKVFLVTTLPPHQREFITEGNLKLYYFNFA